jgi:hypothetical protein
VDISAYTDIEKRLAQAKRLLEEGARDQGMGVLKAALLSHPGRSSGKRDAG